MNKKILALAAAATLLAGFASSAFSANPRIVTDERIDRAIETQELAVALAPIKSRADLARYMANNRLNPDNPLNALSPRSKQRFLNSLRFGERGLSSFNYADVESQLTATQAYRLLALFGMQHLTPQLRHLKKVDSTDVTIMGFYDDLLEADYKDYKCAARATCSPSLFDICTSNC